MLRALICLGALVMPAAAFAFTGEQLDTLCTNTDAASRNACKGYVQGAADGIYNMIDAIGGTTGPRVGQYFCLPPKTRPQDLVDAVRKYVAEHPEAADYNAVTVVALGLGKKYPCADRD
jgi:hypothetical protein